ncbi:hypothetical protein M407DRAFT_27966 [Tulasnella calospora MUT 4182]|uniref:Uncharacterized protein n=1 Tax=Tulasnella calospora MUT 4182 TaxID=1051891 RepID=A0A0C3QCU7_9AGAM|nr:hypothetical protein M407DRAFT_27966 [Tulasnella calospora MUT 4182]
MRHPTLPLKVASTVQKALALDHGSFLSFRPNLNTQSASWRSQDEDGNGWNEELPSFDISFRGTDRELAGFFCAFVRGVRMSVGDTGSVVVDLGRSVSGTFQETFGLELDHVVPTLSPSFFEGLNVIEVRAEAVDGFLQYLKETLGPVGSEDWCLEALQTIRLRAIEKEELNVMPDESARCCLEDFIGHIRRERYGIGLDEPKPEDEETMSVILQDEFMIRTETARALEEGGTLCGIEIDHSDATLVYPGDEEDEVKREVEEEAEEEEVEEDGSD